MQWHESTSVSGSWLQLKLNSEKRREEKRREEKRREEKRREEKRREEVNAVEVREKRRRGRDERTYSLTGLYASVHLKYLCNIKNKEEVRGYGREEKERKKKGERGEIEGDTSDRGVLHEQGLHV